ncbi:hypothetical protein [Nitrospirillum bahiense]|uniref:Uncharacterized protein n=1 Tax=Nitrospirillum amazonense TaxID=28077 RepID=A0A560F1T3_9PROT|nr:hypothetical protein [Nitrospirillum amazonense]TWB15583.1 hypothetical protein FBZ88_12936 [Nitrospirillum amazonense]
MTLTDPLISRIAAGLVATGGYLTALAHRLCAPKAAAPSQPAERNVIMIDPTPPAVPASPAPTADPVAYADGGAVASGVALVGEQGPELIAPLPLASTPTSPTLGDLAAQLRAATEEFRDARSAAAQARLALTAAEEGKADALATLTAAQDAFGKASAALMGDASGALALDAAPVEG